MANVIQIKRGSTEPNTSNLEPFELGYDYTNDKLYIRNKYDTDTTTVDKITEVGAKSIAYIY